MDASEVDEAIAGAAEAAVLLAERDEVEGEIEAECEALRAALAEAHAELDKQGAPPGETVHGRVRDLARVIRREGEPKETHLPKDREGRVIHFSVAAASGEVDGYATVNFMPGPEGRPREVFLRIAKPSGASEAEADHYAAISALLDATMMCMSKALAAGVPVAWFARMFRRVRFEPSGRTNLSRPDGSPFWAQSLLDLVGFLLERYVYGEKSE